MYEGKSAAFPPEADEAEEKKMMSLNINNFFCFLHDN